MKEQEKFEKLIDALGVSIYQFGKDLGFARVEPIYKILRGDTKDPGSSIYAKIKKAYPNVSLDWLVTGEGSIFSEGATSQNQELVERISHLETENKFLQTMYEKAVIEKAASLGKSEGAALLSPDTRDRDLRKIQFNDHKKSLKGKRGISKPVSGRVQGAYIPSLLELFKQD
jgi:hypothetical protein